MVAEMWGGIRGGSSRYKSWPHEGMRHDCLRMDGYQVSMTGGLATMISSPETSAVGGGLATVEGTGNNTLPEPGHCKSTRLDRRQTNPKKSTPFGFFPTIHC